MRIKIFRFLIGFILATCSTQALATQDMYPGDASIYGLTSTIQPNVLVVLDTSGSMSTDPPIPAGAYDPTNIYPPSVDCTTATTGSPTIACVGSSSSYPASNNVYIISSDSISASGTSISSSAVTPLSSVTSSSCGGNANPNQALATNGYAALTNKLNSSGSCTSTAGTTIYATGNYINFLNFQAQYDNSVTYTQQTACTTATSGAATIPCVSNNVYLISSNSISATGTSISATSTTSLSSVTSSSCGGVSNPKSTLTNSGYATPTVLLNSSGSCSSTAGTPIYATGNYINFLNTNTATKAKVATDVLRNLIVNTPNVKFGLMTFYTNSSGTALGEYDNAISKFNFYYYK